MLNKGYSKFYALKGGWREWFKSFSIEDKDLAIDFLKSA